MAPLALPPKVRELFLALIGGFLLWNFEADMLCLLDARAGVCGW